MKTNLNRTILVAEDAIAYINELFQNNETYHFEDDAHDIDWQITDPTEEEKDQLNVLAEAMFQINNFDPFEILLPLINPDEE